VEHWLRDRDEKSLHDLIRAVIEAMPSHRRSSLAATTANSICLRKADVEEAHFVVRNSSTQALYGFCSTYFYRDSGLGVVGALFVDPTRRNLSIGNSLLERAKRELLGRPDLKSLQLGSGFSLVFPGLPADDPGERHRLREWFGKRDWDISATTLIHRMRLGHLSNWVPPVDVLGAVRGLKVGFDPVADSGSVADILSYIGDHASPGEMEIYKMAVADYKTYPVVRARRLADGAVVGCAIMCDGRSLLAGLLPVLQDSTEVTGGILSPIVSAIGPEVGLVLQGLLLYGVRRLKAQGLTACIVDMVSASGCIL
jgi:beta-N-acetylhexosaminidase